MKTKASLTLLHVLLPITLMLTSCASAPASSAPDSSVPDSAGTANTAAADMTTAAAAGNMKDEDVQPADAQVGISSVEDAAETDEVDSGAGTAGTDDTAAKASPAESDVDYGTIEADVEYYSDTAGDVKYCNVLLPADYDSSQEYPVLYMFHGFGGRYDSHVHEDSILQTLYGNMLHEGLTVPMIIVGADMYTDLLAEKDEKSDAELRPCYDKGVDDLALDLMPFIESRYSVKKGRLYTAVTGVSQGATDSLAAGFKWQSKIGNIGSFASCPGVIPTPYYTGTFWNTPILEDLTVESPETMPVYIYLTVGTEDPWCIDSTLYYGQVMDDKGIPNHNILVEGYDHDNDMWELGHYNFLLRIFRN